MRSLLFLSCFALLFTSSCKKKDDDNKNPCGSYGGVVRPNTYLFWIDQDYSCGYITVEVKDSDGNIVAPYQAVISHASPVPPECNNESYARYATFDLYMGKTYTYKATCSGKSWSGSIQVPCEQNQCKTIQLQ
jgi:hypothetical protein